MFLNRCAGLSFAYYSEIRHQVRMLNRCAGLSFAYYSEIRHQVRTFGPIMWIWLPYYCYLGNTAEYDRHNTHTPATRYQVQQ